MIHVTITSDSRNEGKTSTAVKLLQADPGAWLLVRPRWKKYVQKMFPQLSPSQLDRIVEDREHLRGQCVEYLIEDQS